MGDIVSLVEACMAATDAEAAALRAAIDDLRVRSDVLAFDLLEARQALLAVAARANAAPVEYGYGGPCRVITLTEAAISRLTAIGTGKSE